MTIPAPYGWSSLNPKSVTYEFGEARFGKAPNDIPANATGEQGGEDDYHSKYVDPDGEFGAAKVGGGIKSSYGGEGELDTPKGSNPPHTGTIEVPFGHRVVEHGNQNFRDYYLVHDVQEDKFYTVVPDMDGKGKEYKSGKKSDRVSALADAYRVLSSSLPDSALEQLRSRNPETPALPSVKP